MLLVVCRRGSYFTCPNNSSTVATRRYWKWTRPTTTARPASSRPQDHRRIDERSLATRNAVKIERQSIGPANHPFPGLQASTCLGVEPICSFSFRIDRRPQLTSSRSSRHLTVVFPLLPFRQARFDEDAG